MARGTSAAPRVARHPIDADDFAPDVDNHESVPMAKVMDRSALERSSRNLKIGAAILLLAVILVAVMMGVGMRHPGPATAPSVAQSTGPAAPAPRETQGTGPPTPTPAETQGQGSPQGPTGPLETKSGGAPAASPQGETPPGMQSAPRGSNEKV
jgi:hypothetical protein